MAQLFSLGVIGYFMQMKEARALRERWGHRPCDHPDLEKEYDLGTATGDYVCTRCGLAGWGSSWNEQKSGDTKSAGADE